MNNITENIKTFVENNVTLSDLKNESWYVTEHKNIKVIANTLEVDFMVFCGMVAICSPLVKWEQNISTAKNLVLSQKFGTDDLRVSGFKRNRDKAVELYNAWVNGQITCQDDIYNFVTGPKVTRFFDNLYNPFSSEEITVDVWMIRLALRRWIGATNKLGVSDKIVNEIRDAYATVYNDLDLEKYDIMPHMLQSILWVKIKDKSIAENWLIDFETVTNFR